MAENAGPHEPTLPPGDEDPNVIYIAVGKAIHRWEGLEEALARLALKMAGIGDLPQNYPPYGKENGTFRQRIAALQRRASHYFAVHPNQALEGEFASLLGEADDLSIERHRIAHGHITMWGEFKMPQGEGSFTVSASLLYRWAPPFYGVEKLRTNPVGLNGVGIDSVSQQFEELHNRVAVFTDAIPELPSPQHITNGAHLT
jgi:hypothetical protein